MRCSKAACQADAASCEALHDMLEEERLLLNRVHWSDLQDYNCGPYSILHLLLV